MWPCHPDADKQAGYKASSSHAAYLNGCDLSDKRGVILAGSSNKKSWQPIMLAAGLLVTKMPLALIQEQTVSVVVLGHIPGKLKPVYVPPKSNDGFQPVTYDCETLARFAVVDWPVSGIIESLESLNGVEAATKHMGLTESGLRSCVSVATKFWDDK